ncbi:protein DA1-related 1 [Ziziphus jujuba]|uniref:Protein DA1-related 1 n=1 Tax=Ziziphus jujuba TaxID=326968 RepID=A0ABM3IXR7_ZIZJJ|nr:protein DA1-related 1 [Ziziphus jujuba]XP_048337544.2 protein DA1-related 1 [Ziziphus jujuba]
MSPDQLDSNPEYWNQIFCSTHMDDGTPICRACHRLKASHVTYIELGDGREICQDCCGSAILDTKSFESLVRKCHEFYKSMNMEIDNDIPFFLVDSSEMAKLTIQIDQDNPFETTYQGNWGIIIHEQRPVVNIITSSSRIGNRMTVIKKPSEPNNGSMLSIAVLFGFTEALTGAILVHEMMHVWLRLQDIEPLELKLEEGICQVISRRWLDWYESNVVETDTETTKQSDSKRGEFLRNLLRIYKLTLELDSSFDYGEGFREAQRATSQFGLQSTIQYIITNERLPL